ncbi:hypothetical protein PAXRUDRAFT_255593 [Paxillus rubicundulus Ve08.2h10]|uniref:Uncharacterized protein n=1 Tax=Paxillus rubicundulus Ve08.2h10 TaxID=930991 RepID=A0A0D0DFV3_9AGAM|nr:hypothetical protein PAXRUDRAFT_255593 [Paxillus rubicundulus Ve08.2h10]
MNLTPGMGQYGARSQPTQHLVRDASLPGLAFSSVGLDHRVFLSAYAPSPPIPSKREFQWFPNHAGAVVRNAKSSKSGLMQAVAELAHGSGRLVRIPMR